LTRKGQLTIPRDIRDKLDLTPGSRVTITVDTAIQALLIRLVKDAVARACADGLDVLLKQ
jgi:AbrB family looped-hinge helix DNA binding protein